MPPTTPPRCRHLHTDGRQCGSPAVRHEKLCYQHHSTRQRLPYTPTLPDPEDLHAVGRGLAELLRLVSRELLEDKQAKRLLAILTAAGTNLARLDRQRRAARELHLRERLLALAEARLAAQHPAAAKEAAKEPAEACPLDGDSRESAFVPASKLPATEPVTDPVEDPELGPLAPGPEPRPEPAAQEAGRPPFATVSPSPREDRTTAEAPEQPSRARQAEIEAEREAEAAEQIEFMRRENARTEEREALRRDSHHFWYQRLSPEARAREDERYSAEIADFFGYTLEEIAQLPSTPVLAAQPEITPQPL